MEEQVGQIWDRFVRRLAQTRYPDAAVNLADVEHKIGIVFRALGGDGGLQLTTVENNKSGGRRSWMQRIAGSTNQAALAWRDEQFLRVPSRIDCFPKANLNYELYLWLAALAAGSCHHQGDWIQRSQVQVQMTFERFPGLKRRYYRLLEAHLTLRPDIDGLSQSEAALELAIRNALIDPDCPQNSPDCKHEPMPVPLWLHPSPPESLLTQSRTDSKDESEGSQTASRRIEKLRKKGELVNEPEKDRGLITVRMENIFSWGEFVNVDRGSEDEDDPNRSEDIAKDLDRVAIGRTRSRRAATIRFDMDLPSEADDDRVLGDGILLPEWDYRKARLLPNRCRIVQMMSDAKENRMLPEHLIPVARRLRNRFQQLAPKRTWVNGQADGDEVDLEAYQRFLADMNSGQALQSDRLYRSMQTGHRDLACLLLADLSLSTDAHVNDEHRVIDIIRDTLYLFAESLSACGDSFAIQGFSTRRRDPIRIHRIKDFDEAYGGPVRSRIAAIKPGYYTRLGAGIRYASQQLTEWPAARRLLLILTDGKPNDLDQYEGRYGVEDTRMAVIAARKSGLIPFCVTIDQAANDYLPYLFGVNNYVVVKNPEELPNQLALLYALLTS